MKSPVAYGILRCRMAFNEPEIDKTGKLRDPRFNPETWSHSIEHFVKISIIVTSYNHEKYIEQCLESVLTQKGDFEMEIILGDDSSIDGTGQILETYQKKHPNLIRKLQTEQNLGITKNLKRCLDDCTGKYIAICEGDDYWTSDKKILRQMQMLETHPEYSMCFSALTLYYEQDGTYTLHNDQVKFPRHDLTIEDLIAVNYIGNFSCCMYRASVVHKLPDSLFKMYMADWLFNMACSEMGKIGFIREPFSVYRIHAKGAWAGKTDVAQISGIIERVKDYNQYFQCRYNDLFEKKLMLLADQLAVRNSKAKPSKVGKYTIFVLMLCTMAGLAVFGYIYSRAAQKYWSWPIAVLLALAWSAVCVLVIRRPSRIARQKHQND